MTEKTMQQIRNMKEQTIGVEIEMNSISFEGATFAIREEQDIHSLAQEIASLIKREQAGKGFRR